MGMPEEEQDHLLLLRQRAEEALQGKPVEVSGLSTEDVQFLLHELQVHQAELAMQNEELRQTQEALEISHDRYADLYNFAPAGYCTINRKDNILEANQSLSILIGIAKRPLTNQTFSHFVARIDRDKYYLYRRRAFENHQHQSTEIRLVKQSGKLIYVRLESILTKDEDRLMIMVIDITEQRDLQHQIIEQREKERQKIARDLHDGPVQVLSAINFSLRGILIDHPDEELAKSLEAIQAELREQIQVLRNYSVELRSPLLAHIGLEMAIRSSLERFSENHPDLIVRLALHPVGPLLSEEASLALFRICQEALQNISKHAKSTATTVKIRLDKVDSQILMEIMDNGSGFDVPGEWLEFAKDGHLGIIGMRERAEAVGGQLEIQSSQEKGTLIRVLVPINEIPSE